MLCAAFVAAGVGMNVQNAIAGYGMNQDVVSLVASGSSNSNSNGSNYLESNASALSSSSNGFGARVKCYTSLEYESGSQVVDCVTCTLQRNQTDKWYNLHDYCYEE